MRRHAPIAITLFLLLITAPVVAWVTNTVPCDFITGGGYIIHNGAHANFGVAGGVKNGSFWGHLEYNDHGSSPPMKVHGTGVTGYFYIDANTRYIQGTCTINGVSGYTYEVKVTDNGEPGRGSDLFSIGLSTGYQAGAWSGDGPIQGGNIQLHKGNASNTPPSDFTCQGTGTPSPTPTPTPTPTPPPSSTTRIEETDPSVIYAGSWISQSRSDLSGGSAVESLDTNGSATLAFNGTGVSWISFKAAFGGIAQVYLDGTLKATVDTYAPTEQPQAVVYTASGLPTGPHTLMIKVTGTWNSSGCCAWIVVDAFDVTS
ncbi:MAG TPA: post-COAP-1 domain-containing protein [Candidatus Dormibacteraeota bacterium]|nr:post-COAP-1 domain-containing protein [Candidatus Dormibacteraeota bacterium]